MRGGGGVERPSRFPFRGSSSRGGRCDSNRQDRVYCLAEFRYQDRLMKRRACSERFWSACWPIAGDKEKRQAPPLNDLADRADWINGKGYVENGAGKNSRLGQSPPGLD